MIVDNDQHVCSFCTFFACVLLSSCSLLFNFCVFESFQFCVLNSLVADFDFKENLASKRFLLHEKPQLDEDAAKTDPLNRELANLPNKDTDMIHILLSNVDVFKLLSNAVLFQFLESFQDIKHAYNVMHTREPFVVFVELFFRFSFQP